MIEKELTFHDCLMDCASNGELIRQFDRRTGHNLSHAGTPVELQADESAGRTPEGLADFVNFVYDEVWTRISPTC